MLFRQTTLQGIAAGRITLAFRKWKRARVRQGTRLRTGAGLVEVLAVEKVDPAAITSADAMAAGFASPDEARDEMRLTREDDGDVFRIALRHAGADTRIALREAADLSPETLEMIRSRLARMDSTSRHGPWAREALEMIEAEPGRRAPDLAAKVGRETLPFKADIRKLKELGLTESLEIGYRISPRGLAYLRAVRR